MLSKTRRVLIFSTAYFPLIGGSEIAVKEITDRLGAEITFDMLTLRFSSKHKKFEKVGNINVYRIGGGLGYLSKILFVPMAMLYALKLNKTKEYDLFWAVMTYMLLPITLLRLLSHNHTPYLLTLQDGDSFAHVFRRWRIMVFKPLLLYGFRHASKVQAISNFLAEWARDMGYKGKIEVIPNGVDVKRFQPDACDKQPTESIVLITTSRLVEKNAVGDIIKALRFLPENVKLKIIGIGPLEKGLKLLAHNLRLGNMVEFLGLISQEEIPHHLHQADIFIRPSLSEGFGSSFVEAMAAGLPVIATPVGGIVDFIEDPTTAGQAATGLFCEVSSPESIAEQVTKLMNDPELRQKLIENGQKMVTEKYDWDLIADEMKTRIFDPAMVGQTKYL